MPADKYSSMFIRICLGPTLLTKAIDSKNCATFSSNQKYIKTYPNSLVHVFPRMTSATCYMVHWIIYVLLGKSDNFGFGFGLEQFSIECRKTRTKVITLANHKGHRQYSEPIKLEVITCS